MAENIDIESIKIKLNPRRFPGMSPVMQAIVCHTLGIEAQTEPAIAELITTSDGMLLARNEGDCGFNAFIGAIHSYVDNWDALINIPEVGLSPEEVTWVRRRYREAAKMDEVTPT